MDLIVDGQRTVAATGDAPFDASKPNLVLIHGAGMDRTVWALQTRHPAFSGWNVLALDLPGHGLSAGKALAGIEAMADWVLAFLDAANMKTAVLGGHSMGALVALETAFRAPGRIEKLALLGVTFPMRVAPGLLDVARTNDISAVRMIIGWAYSPKTGMGTGPAPGLRMTGAGASLLAGAAPGVLYADLKACDSYVNGLDRAGEIGIPALFLLGGRDRMARARGAMGLVDAMAKSSIVTIGKSGHMMMSEAPGEVITALVAFLTADSV